MQLPSTPYTNKGCFIYRLSKVPTFGPRLSEKTLSHPTHKNTEFLSTYWQRISESCCSLSFINKFTCCIFSLLLCLQLFTQREFCWCKLLTDTVFSCKIAFLVVACYVWHRVCTSLIFVKKKRLLFLFNFGACENCLGCVFADLGFDIFNYFVLFNAFLLLSWEYQFYWQ